jgi:hypothetical protein
MSGGTKVSPVVYLGVLEQAQIADSKQRLMLPAIVLLIVACSLFPHHPFFM